MKVIHKYELELGSNIVELPRHSEVLRCANQNEDLVMWAGIDTELTLEARTFLVIETGAEVLQENLDYIGTAMFEDGFYVLHVFEEINK